jgi:hypothetical protein
MTFAAILQEVAARIVAARETLDPAERDAILADLEEDVVGWLEQEYRRAA